MIERVALTTAGVRDRWLRPRLAPASDRAAAAARLASETWALPLLLTLAVAAGIGFVSAITPISGRGDFGQWLMTSRYYLGLDVPAYRPIAELPPLVPIAMAGLQLVIRDPIAALQAVTVAMLLTTAMWCLARLKMTFRRFSPPRWLMGPKFMSIRPFASRP